MYISIKTAVGKCIYYVFKTGLLIEPGNTKELKEAIHPLKLDPI